MPIYVVGPTETYTTIADALTAIAGLPQPLTEYQQVEVKEGIALESVVIPGAITPSAAGPLQIVNHELDRPEVDAVTLDKPYVKFSGFDVKGDVLASEDELLFSENICRGKVEFIGDAGFDWSAKIYNNSIFPYDQDCILIKDYRGTVRFLYNSVLVMGEVASDMFGLIVENSGFEGKYNILTALDANGFARAIKVVNTVGEFVTLDRNMYFQFEGASFGVFEDLSGPTEVTTFPEWQTLIGQDSTSINEDPEFRCLDVDIGINLDVSNTSPAIATGEYDTDVQIDIDKTRRPTLLGSPDSSTTLGAYEEAQRITSGGITRILELIGGISTDAVTKVAVGEEGTISAIEYLRPQTVDAFATELEAQIFMRGIADSWVDGIVAKFKCVLGPTPEMTQALLDGTLDVMKEIGLFTEDGVLFMRRTVYRLPFDPLSVLEATFTFGVSIGPCHEIPPITPLSLVMAAEPVA